jgi:hypothetical protein
MTTATKPIAGRQDDVGLKAHGQRQVLRLPETKQAPEGVQVSASGKWQLQAKPAPVARPPAKRPPVAPRATSQAKPVLSPRDQALRETAKTVADKYVTRDGRILKPWR